jgi:Uma2 family endonuclease
MAVNIIVNPTPPIAPAPPLIQDEPLFEIIDGQRVELPPMSVSATLIATDLTTHLASQIKGIGRTAMEGLFHLALPIDRNRRPDIAFVSFARWPKDRPIGSENAWNVVPEVAIEVISPNDLVEDLLTKLDEYFRAGVRLAWVVFPQQALVYVYESYTHVRVLTRNDVLDGGGVLPEFRLALNDLFPTA